MTQSAPQSRLKAAYPGVFKIDAKLDELVQRIELLSYVNPVNIVKEKKRFFASKYVYEPQFKYLKLRFDPYKLHQQFYSQPLDLIRDKRLRDLYREIIYFYANMVQCIETIGTANQFYYNSLRVYGTPTEKDVENARFILHFEDEPPSPEMEKVFSPEEAKSYFEDYAKEFDFPLKIRFATHMAAAAMVSNVSQSLLIKRNTLFSKNQLHTLANHEIGVHLVTTFNGLNQPLRIFSNGMPDNVETQEGLAVFSEFCSGALTLKRLKELAYRVLASDSLSKGYGFADTFDLIHNQYKHNREDAFTITLRAHRGGGFTKDRLYLSGLKKIFDLHKNALPLDNLLTGKVGIGQAGDIAYLQELGLANAIRYKNRVFSKPTGRNKALENILNNLK